MWKFFILLIFFSCTDLILQDTTQYHSIQLNGNAWIHIINSSNDDNDVSVMNNASTLEFWFTGGNSGDSESACLLSIIDANDDIQFGIFKDPLSPNALEVWLNDERLDPISLNLDENLNSGSTFHHIAITSNENINIYLDGEIFANSSYCDGGDDDIFVCSDDLNMPCIIDSDCGNINTCILECSLDQLDTTCGAFKEGICKPRTFSDANINIGENDLVIGGKVNRELSTLGNFWTGNIDEMRLWSSVLNATIIAFHYNNPEKLAESYEDSYVTDLTGLWRFQFEAGETSPIIPDVSCEILSRIDDEDTCNDYDATIYTLGNSVATFSEKHP